MSKHLAAGWAELRALRLVLVDIPDLFAMHILFLTDNFPPEVNAPATRTHEHCREWVASGHRVTVVTCVPNFPVGKVFNGYRNLPWQREQLDGIDVIRVWSYVTANEGFFRRILDYTSFMASATLAMPFVSNPDIIVATSPQFFTACAGLFASKLKRVPWVFELRDLWPESIRAVAALSNKQALNLLERLELFLYRNAAGIVSVTHAFKQNLICRGISDEKISVVTNGVDLSRFAPRPRDRALEEALGLRGKLVAGYVGTHGLAHSLGTIVDAAAILHAKSRDIHFLFLGDGASKAGVQERAHALALPNVTFIDTVPKEQVARYWSLLDMSIIHLKRAPLFRTVIPSKLFESMAMGIPVLHGVEGESADIVERERAGLIFEPQNAKACAKAVLQLAANRKLRHALSLSGRAAAARYDRKELALRMLCVLQDIHTDYRAVS